MNHLSGVDRLANRFTVMRHAQSTANAGGIIVSRIENDRQGDYGLTEHGRQQALAAAQSCGLPGDTVIYSSDFCRARQTAEIVRAQLGAQVKILGDKAVDCVGHAGEDKNQKRRKEALRNNHQNRQRRHQHSRQRDEIR